jgi:hypothetical protein
MGVASPDLPIPVKPRSWMAVCAVLALAVLIGLALQHALRARLDEIQALASHDVIRARAELAGILRAVFFSVFGSTAALGVAIFAAGRRALREERFPPPGPWSWGARRIVTGPRARAMARAAMGLACTLVLASFAGAALTWYAARVLLACRAV